MPLAQLERVSTRQTSADGGAAERRTALVDHAPAPDALAAALNQSPRSQSLMQLRDMLDRGPRVQAQAGLERALNSAPVQKKPNATGLPDHLKAGVEQLSGLAIDDVRVHYNSAKPAAVQAHAYVQGTDIHVAPGQEQHLPHEAWHVVQQKHGRVKPTLQLKGVAINDNAALEREADIMSRRVDGLKLAGAKSFSNWTLSDSPISGSARPKQFVTNDDYSGKEKQDFIAVKNAIKASARVHDLDSLLKNVSKGTMDQIIDAYRMNRKFFTKYSWNTHLLEVLRQPDLVLGPELKGHSELIYPEPELKSDSEFFDPGFEPEFKGDSELRSESAFNISSGIDGLFDMEYNVNAGEVNVIVKLEINTDVEESEQEKDKANSLATLQEAADHWSDKFRFKSNRGEYVSVKIKAVEDKSFHYRFWPVTNSSQNPNVYRKQKLFMARTSADEKKKAQPSTMHEFGHAIGLGEEYNVETEKDKQGHHYRFASGKHKEEINAIETGEHSNIDASQGSIMGSSGKVLQPRHYTMILKQFELLRKKVVDDTAETWEIEEPSK